MDVFVLKGKKIGNFQIKWNSKAIYENLDEIC